jgi:glycosyltransferase involved in cell wall biosynthesis
MDGKIIKHDGRGMISRGRHRFDVPDTPIGERAQDWILKHNVEHLHGPAEVDYEVDELVALVLLRNGRPYIKPFVEHYLSLGVKHIVFLDNGSTDGTVEALREYQNVTVLRTGVPYKKYNVAMKRYLIKRFGRGRWTLSLDIDELFEYPYSDVVDLRSLLRYLNENSYTAVVCYMLDMFPGGPLSEETAWEQGSLKEQQRFYDVADIGSQSYHDIGDVGNELSNDEIVILKGGIQKKVFSISPLLTKHALIFLDDKIKPMDLSDHWVGSARIADFTCVLLHYKLSANLYELVRREIEERRYISRHGKYDKYFKVLAEAPDLLIKSDTSKELKSVSDLVGTRLVTVSRQYMRFVESEEQRNGAYSEEGRSERLFEAFFNARAEVAACGKRIGELEKRLQEVKRMLRRTRRQKGLEEKAARERQRHLELRARSAERQLQEIQSSRAWKILTALGRVQARARGVLGGLGGGTQRAK